jgi:hypothetical protein
LKPLHEGFRAYSSRAPIRELRPPKVSLPRSSRPQSGATAARRLPPWAGLSLLAAVSAFAFAFGLALLS